MGLYWDFMVEIGDHHSISMVEIQQGYQQTKLYFYGWKYTKYTIMDSSKQTQDNSWFYVPSGTST